MNCGDILQRFWEINRKEHLGSNATMLYFFLIKIYNENSQPLFSYSDVQICEEIGITRPTIKVVREKLKKAGLITYQTKRFHPCEYKIILPDSNDKDFTSSTISKVNEENIVEVESKDVTNTNPVTYESLNTEEASNDNVVSEEKHDVFSEINEELPELDDEYSSRLEPTSLYKLVDKINPTVVQKEDENVPKHYSELTFEEDVERHLKQLREYKATLSEEQLKASEINIDEYEKENNFITNQNPPHKVKVEEKKGSYHTENEKADQSDISSEIASNTSSEEKIEFEKKDVIKDKNGNIPSKEEFLAFAKTVEIYSPEMDFEIATKYETWLEEGWKDGYQRKITDWKSAIKRSMPYFKGIPGRSAKVEPIYRPKNIFSSR